MQYLAPGFLQFCQSFCEANDATKRPHGSNAIHQFGGNTRYAR